MAIASYVHCIIYLCVSVCVYTDGIIYGTEKITIIFRKVEHKFFSFDLLFPLKH